MRFFFLHQVYILVVNSVMFTASMVRNPVLFLIGFMLVGFLYALPCCIKASRVPLVTTATPTLPTLGKFLLSVKQTAPGDNVRWYINMTDPSLEAQGVQPPTAWRFFWLLGQILLFSLPFETSATGKTRKSEVFPDSNLFLVKCHPDSTEDGGHRSLPASAQIEKVISLSSRWLERPGGWGAEPWMQGLLGDKPSSQTTLVGVISNWQLLTLRVSF